MNRLIQATYASSVHIEQFLTALAVKRKVAASTQNQALAALLFLYKDMLECDPGG